LISSFVAALPCSWSISREPVNVKMNYPPDSHRAIAAGIQVKGVVAMKTEQKTSVQLI